MHCQPKLAIASKGLVLTSKKILKGSDLLKTEQLNKGTIECRNQNFALLNS